MCAQRSGLHYGRCIETGAGGWGGGRYYSNYALIIDNYQCVINYSNAIGILVAELFAHRMR